MKAIRIGIVGVGKIARDQHLPCIAANPTFALEAAASRNAQLPGIANFRTLEQMLDGAPGLDAIAICTPTQLHYEAARMALERGKHVLMEKPPCASLAQLGHLRQLASAARVTLYQTWHSQHAPGIASAAGLLAARRLRRVQVVWKEDVLKWHPGQKWIWQAGGFGVLDPGINALSILTRLIAEPIFPHSARLLIPAHLEAPIAAELELLTAGGVEIRVSLDFRHTGPQTWDIDFETDQWPFKLSAGGATLMIGDEPAPGGAGELHGEYTSIYRAFSELIAAGRSEVDARPLELIADIFLTGKQVAVEPFEEPRS
ncbi:MAG TPA: Gfo/Idh/MocA family oxidoreductase [Steroidobacteraceae bacterium]|nr:Gfo/Idh/MocA family oxidoreductase [Steroidobacteraceae bacterium]